MIVKEVDHLLAGPVLGVNTCIDDETNRTPDVGFETTIVRVGVLIKANVFSEAFGVKTPALGEGRVMTELAEGGCISEFARDGYLQVMAGQALVVGNGFDCIKVAVSGIVSVDAQTARTASVRCSCFVIGRRGSFLEVVGHGRNFKGRLGQAAEQRRELRLHGSQVATISIEQ